VSGGLLKNIWVPLSGQVAQLRKVETIANNIANANTSGFKREEVVFKEHLTALTQKGNEDIHLPNKEFSPEDFYHTQGQENAMVKVAGNFTDFTQGTLSPTNNPLDVALFGEGFYEVLTPYGVRFTRKGHFSISKDGEIVNDRGFKLLSAQVGDSQGGDEATSNKSIEDRVIKVPTNLKKLSISKEGEIFTENGLMGQISVVEFKDPHALRKQGNSLFANPYPTNTFEQAKKTAVHQGFVEGSNVNAVKEMAELIKANRHFENIQKAISTYDNISGRAVNDISKF
jgi:flagellar basal-body rod protein FlgF